MTNEIVMSLGQCLDAIWNLPWYKVLCVAVVDDVFLFLKLWPLWIAMIVFGTMVERLK